jgi:hypothetical protein
MTAGDERVPVDAVPVDAVPVDAAPVTAAPDVTPGLAWSVASNDVPAALPSGSGAGPVAGARRGLEFVPSRPLLLGDPLVWLPLGLGDRVLVRPGEAVDVGASLAERVRDVELVAIDDSGRRRRPARTGGETDSVDDGDAGQRSGAWHADAAGVAGELVADLGPGWSIARGTADGIMEAPVAGVVRGVRPGMGIEFAPRGPALPGVHVAGGPTRGRLEIIRGSDADLRPAMIDVGRAGAILVVGSRVDAETLTRARAIGVRGIVVASLSEKDLRDLAASDSRQRASVHRPPPFAVLVLHGALRRPIAGPVAALLAALAGRDVAIVPDPPCLLIGSAAPPLPAVDPTAVRVAHGPGAGREGRWLGLAGRRRFRAGIHLDAGLVLFDGAGTLAVPLADLERYV